MMQTPRDDHHLLSRYRRDYHQTRALANVILDSPEPVKINSKIHVSKLPGDPLALRGIPCLANGVGSAIRGTNPEQAACRD